MVALVLAGCTSAAQNSANQVKAEVAAQMKDPDSSKFTNLKFRLATLCGEVNSKNSFGAYAGAEKFYGTTGAITLRSKAEALDEMLKGTPAAKSNGSAVERFDRDYQECQSEGEAVS